MALENVSFRYRSVTRLKFFRDVVFAFVFLKLIIGYVFFFDLVPFRL